MGQYFTNDENLKSEFRTIIYKVGDTTLNFTSDLGVFSKNKVDFGSNLLINTYLKLGRPNVSILDVGCGYGIIGITLAKLKQTNSTMIDVNRRAVHLTEMNIKNIGVSATTYESDIYSSVSGKFDCVITNPPIRAGKAVIELILFNAKSYLCDNGELWIVIRKDQGAKSMLEKLHKHYSSVEVLEKSKGFYIILCKNVIDSI